jgi:hypothetical protein
MRLVGGILLPFALDPKYLGYLPPSDDKDDAFAVDFEWKNGVEHRLREGYVQYPLHMLFDFYRKLTPPAAHATFAETLESSLGAENSKQVQWLILPTHVSLILPIHVSLILPIHVSLILFIHVSLSSRLSPPHTCVSLLPSPPLSFPLLPIHVSLCPLYMCPPLLPIRAIT